VLKDLHQRLRPILLSSCLDLLWKTSHGCIAVLDSLELDNLVRVAPLVNLENLALVLLLEQITALLLGVNVHDEETNDV
jgi:hypothetical protein